MKSFFLALGLGLAALTPTLGQDFNGTTSRFHNRATITVDKSTAIVDEDRGWTNSANQLGKLAVFQSGSRSNDYWIVATLTLTNTGGTSNGMTLTAGSDVRTWTNATTATTIATNSTFYGSATNLYNALTTNAFANLTLARVSTNGISLTMSNTWIAITNSASWATLTFATNKTWTGTATFSPAFSTPPAVVAIGYSNNLVHIISVTTSNAVFGSATTNASRFDWMAFGPP